MGINPIKKKLLCEFQDMICESCHKVFTLNKLEIHRIRQGYLGGSYQDHRNLKVLCTKCHDILSSADRIASGIQSYTTN